jgi:hypothetical protein
MLYVRYLITYLIIASLMTNPSHANNACVAIQFIDLLKANEELQNEINMVLDKTAEQGRFFFYEKDGRVIPVAIVDGQQKSSFERIQSLQSKNVGFVKDGLPDYESTLKVNEKKYVREGEQYRTWENGELKTRQSDGDYFQVAKHSTAGERAKLTQKAYDNGKEQFRMGSFVLGMGAIIGAFPFPFRGLPNSPSEFVVVAVFGFGSLVMSLVGGNEIADNHYTQDFFINPLRRLWPKSRLTNTLSRVAKLDPALGQLPVAILQLEETATPAAIDRLLSKSGLRDGARRVTADDFRNYVNSKRLAEPDLRLNHNLSVITYKSHDKAGLVIRKLRYNEGRAMSQMDFLGAYDDALSNPIASLGPKDQVDIIYLRDRDFSGRFDANGYESPVGYVITAEGKSRIYIPTVKDSRLKKELINRIYITLNREDLCDRDFDRTKLASEEIFKQIGQEIVLSTNAIAQQGSLNSAAMTGKKAGDAFLSEPQVMDLLMMAAARNNEEVLPQSEGVRE